MDHLHAALAHQRVLAVEQQAIVKTLLDIVYYILNVVIIVVVKSLFYCSEVDWLLHDFKVVGYLKPVWVYRVVEDLGRVDPPEGVDQPLCGFIPAVVKRGVRVIYLRHWHICELRIVFEDIRNDGTRFAKLLELSICDLLVNAIFQNSQTVLLCHLILLVVLLNLLLLRRCETWKKSVDVFDASDAP